MVRKVYIIDQIEHGNGGVCNLNVLDRKPLEYALRMTPQDYDVTSKEWGFWPVICSDLEAKHILYRWDEDTLSWIKEK